MEHQMNQFETTAYKRSRTAYTIQCAVEYFVTLLVTDAFLAKLLTNIGLSDSLIGIVSSFVSFSFLFQLMSIWIVGRMKSVKKAVLFFDCFSQFLYMCMYCVPFMETNKGIKTIVVIVAIILAYVSKYIVSAILFKWANSYVEPTKRGRFSAVKEMISLFCGMGFTLSVGFVVDSHEAAGNIKNGFIFIIIVLFALNIFNFISLMGIKDGEVTDNSKKLPIKDVLANTIGNNSFRSVIILLSMWSFATHMTTSFMGTFKTKDLLLSVGAVQVINAVANGMRIVCSIPLGKYSDKKSYSKGIELALIIAAAGFAINVCTTNRTWWLIIVYTILYHVSVAGTNANKFNITYSYVKNEYIAQAMAIQNSISGVAGFCASLIGSAILSHVQKNGNMLFGIPVYGQQVLSAISLVIVIAAIIFSRTVVEKQKIILQ